MNITNGGGKSTCIKIMCKAVLSMYGMGLYHMIWYHIVLKKQKDKPWSIILHLKANQSALLIEKHRYYEYKQAVVRKYE